MEFTAVLWDYRKNRRGVYQVKIRICEGSNPAVYENVPPVKVSAQDWDKQKGEVKASVPGSEHMNRIISAKLAEVKDHYLRGVADRKRTSAKAVIESVRSQGDFYYWFQKGIDEARERDSHHRADNNASMLRVFQEWRKVWPIEDLTVESLKSLEKFLRKRGNSPNTIADKMIRIRTAVESMGKLLPENPFDDYAIKIHDTENNPLGDADIQKLRTGKIPGKFVRAARVRDFWLAMYNAAGMRWGDFCRLKRSNLILGRIRYKMHKTNKLIDIPQTDEFKQLVKKYLPAGSDPEDYVFPILPKLKTEKEIQRKIKSECRNHGRALNYLAKLLELSQRPTIHDSRHTFADKVNDIGAAKDLLGHKSVKTTQIYKQKMRGNASDKAMLKALETKPKKTKVISIAKKA